MGVGYVCVYLRRGDIRMPKHLLDRANIGPVLDKMRSERMAQSVRRNAFEAASVAVRLYG